MPEVAGCYPITAPSRTGRGASCRGATPSEPSARPSAARSRTPSMRNCCHRSPSVQTRDHRGILGKGDDVLRDTPMDDEMLDDYGHLEGWIKNPFRLTRSGPPRPGRPGALPDRRGCERGVAIANRRGAGPRGDAGVTTRLGGGLAG